jgi:hypothetical protein
MKRGGVDGGTMTPDEKIDKFRALAKESIDKFRLLDSRGIDSIPALQAKWRAVDKTMKVIGQKVAAVGAMVQAKNSPAAERSLDRLIVAAELLNLELDELIAETEPKK